MTTTVKVYTFAGFFVGSLIFSANLASAGQILLTNFGGGAVTSDFDGLGFGATVSSPQVIDGHTISGSGGFIRYGQFAPLPTGATGELLGTNNSDQNSSLSFDLATPVQRAGLLATGFAADFTGNPWTVRVEFFDGAATLLGTVNLSATTRGMEFAGWETDAGPISSIVVTDTDTNVRVIAVDDLIVEVPEPAAGLLGAMALVGYVTTRRWGYGRKC